ncbi:hypothetical protein H0H81_008414 [Sphagnurus paluster]|uniref:Uncharacterized protein n=1 Tax=Sphagnurus paluster TaxID=117069 RepID=A0A9P7K4X3_9AGAR|nr:hypothetical protein H0H81_008414 [Sphagnurus paluster]
MSTATLPPSTVATVGWPSGMDYYDPDAERVSKLIDEGIKAESGKSTLHKQFQLFYASQTLERELPSWRPVVYLNIVRALRTIMDGLEYEVAQSIDTPPDPDFPITKGIRDDVARMDAVLRPLLDAESLLSADLNGGLTGRASAYARSGWQGLINPRRSSSDTLTDMAPGAVRVAEILQATRDAVESLWRYPLVASLLARRKLRVDDSAP